MLWPDIADAWHIFRRCRWQVVSTFGGMLWNGIAANEIESVGRMAGIQLDGELLDDIREIESAASQVLNSKEQK